MKKLILWLRLLLFWFWKVLIVDSIEMNKRKFPFEV